MSFGNERYINSCIVIIIIIIINIIINIIIIFIFTQAPQGVRVIKCNRFPRQKGVMVPGVPCVDHGNWGQDLALCEYCGDFFGKNHRPYT